jgi:hypothetical protein
VAMAAAEAEPGGIAGGGGVREGLLLLDCKMLYGSPYRERLFFFFFSQRCALIYRMFGFTCIDHSVFACVYQTNRTIKAKLYNFSCIHIDTIQARIQPLQLTRR